MAAGVARFGFVVVAATVLAGASGAQAAFDVAMNFTGWNGLSGTVQYYDKESAQQKSSGGIGIGVLNWNVISSTNTNLVPLGGSFPTFCIELERFLSNPGQFYFNSVQNAPDPKASSPFAAPNDRIGATREGYLRRLYDIAYFGLTQPAATATDFAAFQLAVWEITHETSGTFNVSSNPANRGTFFLESGGNAGAVSTANNWLTSVLSADPFARRYNIYALSAEFNQDQVFPTAAPEASAIAIWGLILMSVGFVSYRFKAHA